MLCVCGGGGGGGGGEWYVSAYARVCVHVGEIPPLLRASVGSIVTA